MTPTPILITPRTRRWALIGAFLALVVLLWFAPSVLAVFLGGGALALVLSFPVRLLQRVMRRSLAIALSFLGLVGLLALIVAGVVPVLVEQAGALADAAPELAQKLEARVPSWLAGLEERGLLPQRKEPLIATLKQNLADGVQQLARRLVGSLGGIVTGTLNTLVSLFGMVFIAAYLLADARTMHSSVLRSTPRVYRPDVQELWTAFGESLARYLGGLAISLAVQGALSAAALAVLGVPYALLLGAWVAITALIPFLGAMLGAVPAILLALTVSPTAAILTAVLFLLIQQLEGNVLTPRLQSQAVRVHPILVFLAVIAGGELAGIAGIIFAVPVLAVCRVLYDFFSVRVQVVSPPDCSVPQER